MWQKILIEVHEWLKFGNCSFLEHSPFSVSNVPIPAPHAFTQTCHSSKREPTEMKFFHFHPNPLINDSTWERDWERQRPKRAREKAQTQTQQARSLRYYQVHSRAWPGAEALPSAWGEQQHRAPFDTILNSTPVLLAIILWHGSWAQPCPKNCTEVSGTCSNNNTQWGLLSLIKPGTPPSVICSPAPPRQK